MAKYTISEERLNAVISNCIKEALQDEGLGTKIAQGLGKARQWAQNKVDNYTNAFNAGRNQQRFANKDYDPYQGMNGANNYRNFGGDEYGQYRYNATADRNNTSKQSWNNQYGTRTNKRPSAGGERAENYVNGKQQRTAPQSNEPQANPALNKQPAAQQVAQQQGVGTTKHQINAAKQLVNQLNTGKAKKNIILTALGEYEKNHQISESVIREVVINALKKYMD